MDSMLPATGTAELLELLSPFVPDDFINRAWPQTRTGGRRRQHSAAQLFRVHLLSLLTPVHSLNLLVRLLPSKADGDGLRDCATNIKDLTCACCTSFERAWG